MKSLFKPTISSNRIEVVDALRGFALLGVLFANIPFGGNPPIETAYDETIHFLYNFLMSGNFEEKILSMGYGSAQPNISPSQIENIDIFFQDDDKQKEYLKISNPIYDKVLMNNSQIQSLKKTRDTLLPKLMSGQLRINDYKV